MTATAGPAAGTTLRITRVIDAPRERVFRAWTDPDLVREWFGGPVARTSGAELDVRVGGTFRIEFESRAGSEVWCCLGSYVEVAPPERLVYTFSWEGPRVSEIAESLVTVEFRDLGESTEVTIIHERNRTRAVRDFHEGGWRSSLDRLAELLREQPAT